MWLDVLDEPPILNGFGEVLGLDVFTVYQVSDGSSGFEYLIVGTGDQTEFVICSNSYQLGPMGWRCATWRRCWDGPASTRRLAERAASMVPDDVESFYRAGAAALHTENLDEAIRYFRQTLELDAKHAQAHKKLGVALRRKRERDGALMQFERAVALDPGYSRDAEHPPKSATKRPKNGTDRRTALPSLRAAG